MQYKKPERISLKNNPNYSEQWIEELIAQDPSLLGLGDLEKLARQRIHPQAGRLDLLLQNRDATPIHRYEVEIQLGKTDESHIIRTIEYWDIERKRYPHYKHTAVIVAEDITSRFLNVISLFNGVIPLIAIQIQAIQIEGHISLIFTTVLNETSLGVDDEDEKQEPTDRAYWEARGSKISLEVTDSVFSFLKDIDSALELKYNKHYIGIAKMGQPNNFATFRPKKEFVRVEIKLSDDLETKRQIEEAGFDFMDYEPQKGQYRLRLRKTDVQQRSELLRELLKRAYEDYN